MRLSLKTKFTLATSLLVLLVVTVVSSLYLARLMRQTLRQANDTAGFIAQQVLDACGNALKEAAEQGEAPASFHSTDLHNYVQRVFDNSSTLNSLIESDVGISPTIYEITISDSDATVMISSDATLRGQKIAERPAIRSLARAGFFQQMRELLGPPQTYEFSLPFLLEGAPFGDIRVGLSSALIRKEIPREALVDMPTPELSLEEGGRRRPGRGRRADLRQPRAARPTERRRPEKPGRPMPAPEPPRSREAEPVRLAEARPVRPEDGIGDDGAGAVMPFALAAHREGARPRREREGGGDVRVVGFGDHPPAFLRRPGRVASG